ncbi:hypothetical protein N7466_000707 [Penicillium verhagenii]|uniref:uncharacterized protein n=1 Tax=Penicillium verhagenii TaxID=1562060 RepID=UPI0025456292|nr:uncharacterized protein N7466_000707 [Penicillium verhagenii]KAJ5947692.1 hypothetical protein N7466_000707 [Penicillium verhagenii]
MPRRDQPPPGYWEGEDFESERERCRRPRRSERSSFEEEVRYRRREPMPLVDDMERIQIRDRPPREFVRETFIGPPRDFPPPVRMRRSADDVGPTIEREESYTRTRPRRSHERIDERETRRNRRPRTSEFEEEDLSFDERERRGPRRPPPERVLGEEEIMIRRGVEAPQPPVYRGEIDERPRERRYSDVRDEVFVRSSETRRKPRRRDMEFGAEMIDEREERPRRSNYRNDPSPPMSKEEEIVMQWKDRPSPRELEEEEEVRWRDKRRQQSPPRARYGRGSLSGWHGDREDEFDARSQRRSRPDRGETDDDEEIDIRSSRRSNPRWEQTDEEIDIRPKRRPRHERDFEKDEEVDIKSSRRSRPARSEIDVAADEEMDAVEIWLGEREEDEEIDTRREKIVERGPRRRSTEIEEVITRKESRKSSSSGRNPSPEPIRAPPIHQDFITHHRHIDHGLIAWYLLSSRSAANFKPGFDEIRPPRISSPESDTSETSFDEVDMHRRTRKNVRESEEDISITRRDGKESISPTTVPSSDFHDPWRSRRGPRSLGREDEPLVTERIHSRSRRTIPRDLDEIDKKIEKMKASSLADDVPQKSIDEWSIVHAPSKEEAIEMSGALDIIEVAPKGAPKVESEAEVEVEEEVEVQNNGRARPKVRKERRDERWTEITKDLVVRDAIEDMGYEFEETKEYYYIFSFLEPADIDELVEASDHIRQTRRRRIKEMHRERASIPARSASLVGRMPPRIRLGGRHVREREWIIDGHR